MFGTFGWVELILILIIVLVVYGAGKLPQLGEGVGKAIQGFKRSMRQEEEPPSISVDPSKVKQSQDPGTAGPGEVDPRNRS